LRVARADIRAMLFPVANRTRKNPFKTPAIQARVTAEMATKRAEISRLLAQVAAEAQKQDANTANWADVGTLDHIRETLAGLLEGFQAE
jgi:hypothetical protein